MYQSAYNAPVQAQASYANYQPLYNAPAFQSQTYQSPSQQRQPVGSPPPTSSSSSSQQSATKTKSETSKLNAFLSECLAVGCLKGFKYYELYLRGREELLLRVYNVAATKGSMSRQPSSMDLARSHSKGNLSLKSQKRFVTNAIATAMPQMTLVFPPNIRLLWSMSMEALPPASPCDRELEKDSSKTAFLIAGYARYKCPYVWLRTNHTRFKRFQESAKVDDPLKLETVNSWKTSDDVKASDIIAELISITVQPPPKNPFAVDHTFYDTLPLEESLVCVSAMIDFLQKVYIRDTPYAEEVFADLQLLQSRHWDEFGELMLGPLTTGSKRQGQTAGQ
ncbi:hypothetical protein RI367_001096 [Sorochytrium milnesiophthora]